MGQLYTNNASTLLAIAIDDVETSIVLDAGTGVLFPQPVAVEDYFLASLENTAGQQEICKCTARAADTLIVERGYEGTTAIAFASGSRVECRLTAGTMANLMTADNPVIDADLNLNGYALINGEIVGVPIRGDSGVTTNEIDVPSGGGAPTIGGSKIWHAGNDGAASGLDADTVDGKQASQLGMPVGTKCLFVQAAPPTGWTIDTTHNDRALRISGTGALTGGTTAFSSIFGPGKTAGSHVLTAAEMPSHNHLNGIADNYATGINVYATTTSGMPGASIFSIDNVSGGNTYQGYTSSAGSGSGHSHTLNLDLKYVDVVVGTKD